MGTSTWRGAKTKNKPVRELDDPKHRNLQKMMFQPFQ